MDLWERGGEIPLRYPTLGQVFITLNSRDTQTISATRK